MPEVKSMIDLYDREIFGQVDQRKISLITTIVTN